MSKRYMLLFAFISSIFATSGMAVPSVKMLGNNASTVVKKANTATPKQTERRPSTPASVKAKVATTPTIKTTTKTDQTRFPAITLGKSFSVAKVPVQTTTASSINQPVNTGVSEQELNAMNQRIEALESQNGINDVVESEPGTYVTDVAADGNKLNVTKTQLLYAPVRNENNDTITGNAEIWIVK